MNLSIKAKLRLINILGAVFSFFIVAYMVNEISNKKANIADSANNLISRANSTRDNLSITMKKSKDTMHKSTYIATKTKELIEVKCKKNIEYRKELENNVNKEISRFKL